LRITASQGVPLQSLSQSPLFLSCRQDKNRLSWS